MGESQPLPIAAVIGRGWQAFARAPWLFVGFTLLGLLLSFMSQWFQDLASNSIGAEGASPLGWGLLFVLGLSMSVVVSLWMNIGLLRGAWIALAGNKPSWTDVSRWDGQAMRRLFLMALLLLGVNVLILVIAGLSGALLSLIRFELSALPLLAAALVMLYVAITQMFHLPLVVARGDSPQQAFQAGRHVADPQFFRLLGFAVLLVLIGVAGLLLLGVGVLVAAPVMACSLVAAYQHLFGNDDRSGFLKAN